MNNYRPLSPTFDKQYDLVMRDLGGSYVSRNEEKAPIQYCQVVGGGFEGPRVYRCSPLLHEAMADPQVNFTEYPELPKGAIAI